MGHFRLYVLDSGGGGVFGGFGGGVVEVRGAKGSVKDRGFVTLLFLKENGRRTGGLLGETLLFWSHQAFGGQVWEESGPRIRPRR